MSRLAWTSLSLAPLVLVPLAFVAVLSSGGGAPLWRSALPREAYRPDRCTWYCHNHGCPHRSVLPQLLAGDDGLFGATVRALHAAGRSMSPGRPNAGYGLANLIAFCVLWPGAMYVLWVVAIRQRRRLRSLRRGGG